MACSRKCQGVSCCAGVFLVLAGVALLLVGMLDLRSTDVKIDVEVDGAKAGTLPVLKNSCQYAVMIEKGVDCDNVNASVTVGTLSPSCGTTSLPKQGNMKLPLHGHLDKFKWTVGSAQLAQLQIQSFISFAASEPSKTTAFTSTTESWIVDLCDAFLTVFDQATRSIVMIAVGAVLLAAGLLSMLVACCCCMCCGSK
eukprot:TRINITY_DN59554_c0_g1_i1.p1 TRINITY_DN59554_c0_g1~~TRINITY_DN59554_c0_g1_i1.p1  ORF type:complete len:197 (+),score=33.91 TRINITY_DN59554_c0_g1_i1:82-672(+)